MSLMFTEGYESTNRERLMTNAKSLIEDLMLDKLAERINLSVKYKLNGEMLLELFTDDLETIRSRQAISRDFFQNDGLLSGFQNVYYKMEGFHEINDAYHASSNKEMSNLFTAVRWMELYITVICDIQDIYEKHSHNIKSNKLLEFGIKVKRTYETEKFQCMKNNITNLLEKTTVPKSAKLGINLTEDLTPVSITCIDLYNDYFQPKKLLEKDSENTGIGKFRYKPAGKPAVDGFEYIEAGSSPVLAKIKKYQSVLFCEVNTQYIDGIDGFMKQLNFNEKSTIRNFILENADDIISIIRDLSIFIGGVKFAKELMGKKLPVCLPIFTNEIGTFKSDALYNILLPFILCKPSDIVKNNVEFIGTKQKILMGPNRGGKTTLIQAIGLNIVLAQLGLFAAGNNVVMSSFDSVFTLFQNEEKYNLGGRFSHEARLLKEIYCKASSRSFILLNELFASTSPTEGLYLLAETVLILNEIGCAGIIVTHYHKLYDYLTKHIEDKEIKSRIDFISFGISGQNGARSYKLENGPGEGNSHAIDIVKLYTQDL